MSQQSRLVLSDPDAYVDLLMAQAEQNALLLALAAPKTCASCAHTVSARNGWQVIYACTNPDLKLVNNGDGTGIELLDFGCLQWEARAVS